MSTVRMAVISSAILSLTACDKLVDNGEWATRACEEQLKDDLTSPSSYRRVWSSYTPAGPLSRDELIDSYEEHRLRAVRTGNEAEAFVNAYSIKCLKNPKSKDCSDLNAEFDRQLLAAKTAFVLIQFESANSFNAMLPAYYNCRIRVFEGSKPTAAQIISGTILSRDAGNKLKALAEQVSR